MPIRIFTGEKGLIQLQASFHKNYRYYLQEALGLGIFMVSACFFGAMFYAPESPLYTVSYIAARRDVWMGAAMGLTALFIFYSPFTSGSGSQINPAVTLTFLRLDRMCRYDALFYIIFQLAGAVAGVWLMQLLMGHLLTDEPVNTVITVPGKTGTAWAAVTELVISFFTMSVVLFTTELGWKKYTKVIAAGLVCAWVILAGPLSGFGMNPARSFASALLSGKWNAFWIYAIMPVTGMLLAAGCYLRVIQFIKQRHGAGKLTVTNKRKSSEPFEFML